MNLDKLNIKLKYLMEGRILIMQHVVFGKYEIYFNPQRNVLIANPLDEKAKNHENGCHVKVDGSGEIKISKDTIQFNAELFVFWGHGEWWLEVTPPGTKIIEVAGVYEKI